MTGPRKDFLCKDDVFMLMAIMIAQRSKDPNTQVGACLVDIDNRVIGMGYNGFPRDISNYDLPWEKDSDNYDETKYAYVAHAEENAIDNSDKNRLSDSRIYVTLFPCNKCAIRIIQNKIKEVVYLSDKYHDSAECKASRKMFKLAGIKVRKIKPKIGKIYFDISNGSFDIVK